MIHIVTPCHRPENLERIKETIPAECNWIIVFDSVIENPTYIDGAFCMESGMTGDYGAHNRNFALDKYAFEDNDWITFLDSDNIIHPEWYSSVKGYADADYAIITWGQLSKKSDQRLAPTDSPSVGNIDSASFMVKWRYVSDIRWSTNYTHDGEYARECASRGPLLMLEKYISFYNYL